MRARLRSALLPVLMLLAVVGYVALAPASAALARATGSTGGPDYQAAVRCTGGVWKTIADEGHQPTGIVSITATSTYVQVNHVPVAKVGAVASGGDTDYMNAGITVPAPSAGLTYDRFEFFKGGVRISPAKACDIPYTNFFVMGFSG